MADQSTPETEYFLWVTLAHTWQRQEICFYSLKDSSDAKIVKRLCRLFQMKYADDSQDMPEWERPEFSYTAEASLNPDRVLLLREELAGFLKPQRWDPNESRRSFNRHVYVVRDNEKVASICFQQAVMWESALKGDAQRSCGEKSLEKGGPDAQEARNYYLRLCVHKEDPEGKTLGIQSFDGVEEKVTYFYRLQDKQVGERLVRLFSKRFADRDEAVRDAYCIQHTFGCQAASELDEDERFFVDEEIDNVAAEVSGYAAQWQVDCLELDEPPWVHDPYDPPLYNADEPLSAGCLHHQASKWEDALRPKQESRDEEPLETLLAAAGSHDSNSCPSDGIPAATKATGDPSPEQAPSAASCQGQPGNSDAVAQGQQALEMSPEDRRNSALLTLMLLAQAYYKFLECAISIPCGTVDLELNQYYLWIVGNLTNLLKNSKDLSDFPVKFEPMFPDLYPSTIRDLDWEDMVAPEAEQFLSTVQQYVHSRGAHDPESGSPAWVFVEMARPGIVAAIEKATAYNARMRQAWRKILGSADQGSTGRSETDASREGDQASKTNATNTGGTQEAAGAQSSVELSKPGPPCESVPANSIGDARQPEGEATPGTSAERTKQQPWSDDAPEYLPLTEVAKLTDGRRSLSTLSRLMTPAGEMRYMRKGHRCKVHTADFYRYMKARQINPEYVKLLVAFMACEGKGDIRFAWKCNTCGVDVSKTGDRCPNRGCPGHVPASFSFAIERVLPPQPRR